MVPEDNVYELALLFKVVQFITDMCTSEVAGLLNLTCLANMEILIVH